MSNQLLLSYWDAHSKYYAQLQSNPLYFGYTLIQLLNIHQADSIIEAGCGPGMLISHI